MKIVQVVNHFYPCKGGKESIVKDLALQLKKKGHDVEVLCLNKCADSNDVLEAESEWNGIKVKRVGFLDLKFLKVGFPSLGALREADVVHAHGICFLTDFLAIAKLLYKKPLVLSTHGGIFHTKALSGLKRIYFNVWLRLVGRAFDKVIAVSKNDFEMFSRIFPAEKMALAENAIDVEKLYGIKRKATGKSFLFVGRLSKNKRVDLLLDAIARVKGAELTVAGKDFDGILPELKRKAMDLGIAGKVNFAGEVSEEQLLELMAKHHFFVSASSYEGFGVSAIEAMAAGLVPVLNDIPPFREFVGGRKNGFIVDFGDREKAAEVLSKACSLGKQERGKLSRNARAYAGKFSWSERVKEFERLYQGVKA